MERTINTYSQIHDKITYKLLKDICREHYEVAKDMSNIKYLWFMYTEGSKAGTYKPFILLAEINLLIATKFIDKADRSRMVSQIKSVDSENLYMLFLAIKSLRDKRIKELGVFTTDNVNYNGINYEEDVISPKVFEKI